MHFISNTSNEKLAEMFMMGDNIQPVVIIKPVANCGSWIFEYRNIMQPIKRILQINASFERKENHLYFMFCKITFLII